MDIINVVYIINVVEGLPELVACDYLLKIYMYISI